LDRQSFGSVKPCLRRITPRWYVVLDFAIAAVFVGQDSPQAEFVPPLPNRDACFVGSQALVYSLNEVPELGQGVP
tara:strand:- start:179 stop:403 length:225 start_codon:yes stop_codon:yes gene_type:complete